MAVEALILEAIQADEALSAQLAKFDGQPAVFYQTAPPDTDPGWDAVQYPRIDFVIDWAYDPERQTDGSCAVNVWCLNNGQASPEDVGAALRECLRDTFFTDEDGEVKKYLIPYGARLNENIVEGAHVEKGAELTMGAVNPHDVLAICGTSAVYNYLIKEVQFAYRTQGVDISDKHIEVIVRQMLKKCEVKDAGDTNLISGTMTDVTEVEAANREIRKRVAAGEVTLKEAEYQPLLMGITKAALATDSFLSAASFQETTRVLTDAAIKGKSDKLLGLKENVIIGKLVPAGTGMDAFKDVDVVPSYFSTDSTSEILNLEQLQELLTNSTAQ